MNNRGQSLILFVICLPIVLVLCSMIIEYAYLAYNKAKVYSVSKTIIANCLDACEKNDIIELYKDNKIDVDNIQIEFTNGINIKGATSIDRFLGNILSKDNYEITFSIYGYAENNKMKYKKGK